MGPLIFFILRGYIDKVYTFIYIYIKKCHEHSYGFKNLMSSWGVGI